MHRHILCIQQFVLNVAIKLQRIICDYIISVSQRGKMRTALFSRLAFTITGALRNLFSTYLIFYYRHKLSNFLSMYRNRAAINFGSTLNSTHYTIGHALSPEKRSRTTSCTYIHVHSDDAVERPCASIREHHKSINTEEEYYVRLSYTYYAVCVCECLIFSVRLQCEIHATCCRRVATRFSSPTRATRACSIMQHETTLLSVCVCPYTYYMPKRLFAVRKKTHTHTRL